MTGSAIQTQNWVHLSRPGMEISSYASATNLVPTQPFLLTGLRFGGTDGSSTTTAVLAEISQQGSPKIRVGEEKWEKLNYARSKPVPAQTLSHCADPKFRPGLGIS